MHFSSNSKPTRAIRRWWAVAVGLCLFACLSLSVSADDKKDDSAQAASSKTLSASFINSMSVLNNEHKLVPGDQLSFRVIEDEDPAKRILVTDSGELDVPYLGLLKVEGKTCKSIGYEIKTALEKKFYYQATVIISLDVMAPKGATSKGRIYLMGQVRQQGPMEIPSDEVLTVGKAILHAGGFGEYANKRKVKVVRRIPNKGGTETKIVDLVDVLDKGKTDKDIQVEPEDLIIVPERAFNF